MSVPFGTSRTIIESLVECPHACVNKLRIRIELDAERRITDVSFGGHETTHDEWTGRPYPKEESQS